MVNPCNVLDALADFQYDIMRRLSKKFEQLRRLARLLEQLGDLSWLIPDLSKLIPIINIDFSVYEQMAAACPFLGLPTNPVQGDLNSLRNQVLSAYNGYARQLLNHPFMRMGMLQEELTNFQNQIAGAMGMGSDYIKCLQAMCSMASDLGSTVSKLANTNISATVSRFSDQFLTQGGQILTEPMQAKYNQAVESLNAIKGMGADVGKDYAELKQTRLSTFSGRQTADLAGTTVWRNPPFVPPPGG